MPSSSLSAFGGLSDQVFPAVISVVWFAAGDRAARSVSLVRPQARLAR